MKIVIDTSPLKSGHKTRGVGQYTKHLVAALQSLESDHKFILTSRVETVSKVDLVHYPYFDLFHSRLPFFRQAPVEIVTVHDLIPLRFPDSFKPGIRSGLNLTYQKRMFGRMQAVITDSSNSKSDIVELLEIGDERVFVVPLGVDKQFAPASGKDITGVRKKFDLPDKFVLYVGDVNVNKNIPTLIRALAGIDSCSLVIVSQAMKNKQLVEVRQIRSLIDDLGLANRVHILTNISVDRLKTLRAIYSAALVYVQPSIYEGFGLPVLEAMACGTPVVSSNKASLPEVAGKAGLLVEPTAEALSDTVVKVIKNKALRDKMRKMGLKRAREFTWEKTALGTVGVYETIAGRHE